MRSWMTDLWKRLLQFLKQQGYSIRTESEAKTLPSTSFSLAPPGHIVHYSPRTPPDLSADGMASAYRILYPTTYISRYLSATLGPRLLPETKKAAARITHCQELYEATAQALCQLHGKGAGMPWWAIGCLHQMESGGDWTRHLANGDPLTSRTVSVPVGLPEGGTPPFTWQEGALAALKTRFTERLTSPEAIMAFFESWNGLGYAHRGLPTPYLWSGTSIEERGKFASDGLFDPELMSEQPGCVALMKALGINVS